MRALILVLMGFAAVAWAEAGPASPVGRWKTIDDHSGRAKSIVRVWEKDGTAYGTIEALFPEPGEPEDPVCDKCEGALKDKPIKGMLIMWGLTPHGSEWSGGRIVDPENGKVYRCKIKVVDGGSRLKVRGYIGISVLGRTQVWQRVP